MGWDACPEGVDHTPTEVVGHAMIACVGVSIEDIHIQPSIRLAGVVGNGNGHGDSDGDLRGRTAGNVAMVFNPGPELRAVQIGA